MVVKMIQNHTGKKQPTNPDKKEQHLERRTKKSILHYLEDRDWEEQLKEYNKNASESF